MVNIILTTWTPTRPSYRFRNLNGNVSPFTTGSFCWWGMSMDESKVNVDSLYYFNPKKSYSNFRRIYRKYELGQIALKIFPYTSTYFLDEKRDLFLGGDSLSFSPPFGRIHAQQMAQSTAATWSSTRTGTTALESTPENELIDQYLDVSSGMCGH